MSSTRYELSPSQRDSFKPKFLYVTEAVYGKDWNSTPHFHAFTEILFVTSGSGTFEISNEKYDIKKGDLVIISPYNLHTESSTPDRRLEYFIVGVDNISFNIISDINFIFDNIPPPTQLNRAIFDLRSHYEKTYNYIVTMHDEIISKRPNYQPIVENLLSIFLLYVMRHTNLTIDTSPTRKASKECAFVKQYIDLNFAYEVNLDELARLAFISKSHLIHSFNKFYGMSPIQYLLTIRLNEGASLLKTTGLSVTQIAKNIGFSSNHHFAEKFKVQYGISPLKYRSQKFNTH